MNTYLLLNPFINISKSWMAAFYTFKIFVYHSQNSDKELVSDVFKVMEKKLFFYIMTPAMTLSWIFGLILIHEIGFEQLSQKWMILKLVFVIILTLYHFYLGRILRYFKLDLNRHSHNYYRYINEIPTLLLILIIFVVIFKPI